MPVGLDSAPHDYFAQSKCPPPPPHSHLSCFSLPYKSERMFWSTCVQGSQGKGGGLKNKPTCHCLDRNATTRGERGVCWMRGETSVFTFLSPFLPPPSLSPLMAGSSQRFFWEGNKDQEGMGDSDLIRCRTSPLH